MDNYFIVLAITTKCPKCGRVDTEHGENLEDFMTCQIECECGFKGELPQ